MNFYDAFVDELNKVARTQTVKFGERKPKLIEPSGFEKFRAQRGGVSTARSRTPSMLRRGAQMAPFMAAGGKSV